MGWELMQKNFRAIFGVGILIIGSLITTVLAGSVDPGSINDPLVTKSYVDEQVKLQVAAQVKLINNQGLGQVAPVIVEELNTGDVVVAKAGTEIILRSGAAVAYGQGPNGIPDLTAGVDVAIGAKITNNHLLLFPRDDGRGIKATSKATNIMVRGNYEIIRAK